MTLDIMLTLAKRINGIFSPLMLARFLMLGTPANPESMVTAPEV